MSRCRTPFVAILLWLVAASSYAQIAGNQIINLPQKNAGAISNPAQAWLPAFDQNGGSTKTVRVSIADITTLAGGLTNGDKGDITLSGSPAGSVWTVDSGIFAPIVHSHVIADITGLQTALNGKAATVHTHAIADTTGLQTALDGKAALVHTHAIADTTGLQAALDGKATLVHTHAASDIVSGTFASARFAANTVPHATLSNTSVNGVLLGSPSTGGTVGEITIGSGLTLTGSTLTAAGGSPGGTTGKIQYNNAGAFAGASDVVYSTGQLAVTPAWSGTGTATTPLLVNVTADPGPANAASKLLDLQVGGTSRLNFVKDGTLSMVVNGGIVNQILTAPSNNPAIEFRGPTIPDFSGIGISPAITTTTTGRLWQNSPTNGGMQLTAFTTSAGGSTHAFSFVGYQGATSLTAPVIGLYAFKHNGTNNRTSISGSEKLAAFFNGTSEAVTLFGDSSIALSTDAILTRDAADTLAQRRGLLPQKLSVYNTWANSGIDYERGVFDWKGTANTLRIGTEQGGTGVARAVSIVTGGTERINIPATGGFKVTGPIDATTAIGNTSGSAGIGFFASGASMALRNSSNIAMMLHSTIVDVTNNRLLGFESGESGTPDAGIQRVSANILGITNGSTGPGKLAIDKVQGTPFERLKMEWDTTNHVARIGTEKGTGGTARDLAFITDDQVRMTVAGSTGVATFSADQIRIATDKTPASATDTGVAGTVCIDDNFIYVCTSTNVWKRAALSTW